MLEAFITVYLVMAAVVYLFKVINTSDSRKKELSENHYVGWFIGFLRCLAWPVWLVKDLKGF